MSRIYFSGTYFYLGISFYILFIITFIFYHFTFERDIVYEFNYLNGNNYYSYKDLNDYSELLNFIYKDKSYKEGKLIYNPYFFFLVITMPAFSTTCFSFISEVNLNNNASFIVFSLIYLIIPQALTSSMYLFKKVRRRYNKKAFIFDFIFSILFYLIGYISILIMKYNNLSFGDTYYTPFFIVMGFNIIRSFVLFCI